MDEKKRLAMGKAFLKAEKEADRKALQEMQDRKNLAEELKVPLEKRLANPDDYSPEATGNKGHLFKTGGKVSSASSRADGCAQRGKTRGKMI